MPSGMWRGTCTASWSGQGSALGEAESSPATVSSTRCSNPSHALSGLWVRSSQLTRSASVWPSCSACTHTPDTAGANQRDFLITCPTSGNQYRPTRPHTESSGVAGPGPHLAADRAVAGAGVSGAPGAPLHVRGFPFCRVLGREPWIGKRERDESQEPGQTGATSRHGTPPFPVSPFPFPVFSQVL